MPLRPPLRQRIAFRSLRAEQGRQLRDVRRDTPSLIAGQHLGGSSSARFILAIHEGEGLTVVVATMKQPSSTKTSRL